MVDVEKVKAAMRKKPRTTKRGSRNLSTGSTLLNLAISGNARIGFSEGQYVLFVGDTSSGKTWLSLTCFAEAAINEVFKDYRLIYDNAENGALMDMGFFFGDKAAKRIEAPRYDDDEPVFSRTIEDFYYNVDDALEEETPFVYILDSVDALTSEPEEKKFGEHKEASRSPKKKKPKGDYGDGKAKISSRNLRKVVGELEQSRSILIILNQTRDNIDAGLFESKKTRSGGWALEFYAHVVMWSSVGGHLKRSYKGKDRELGINSRIRVKKNRVTGRQRIVTVPIYHSFGIDDVGSCVDYLVEEKVWKKNSNGVITATKIGPTVETKRDKLIKIIEERELQDDIQDLVQQTWDDIEEACRVERKSRYR